MSERKIPGWVLPAGVVVLVAVLVVIALVRGPVALDPDTPEGTVQEYLLALSQGRYDEALEVVHEEWRGACEASDLEGFAQGDFSFPRDECDRAPEASGPAGGEQLLGIGAHAGRTGRRQLHIELAVGAA